MNNILLKLLLRSQSHQKVLYYGDDENAAFSPGTFDAIFIDHPIEGLSLDKLKKNCKKIHDLLKADGQICVAFDNKYSYRRLLNSNHFKGRDYFSLVSLLKVLQQIGFHNADTYVLSPESRSIAEVSKIGKKLLKNNVINFRTFIKYKLQQSPLMNYFQPAYAVVAWKDGIKREIFIETLIKKINLNDANRIIIGKPNTIIILFDSLVMKLPLDALSKTRCRINKKILNSLNKTYMAAYVPRILKEEAFMGYSFYCESRLSGVAIDIPIKKMNVLVLKASDFLIRFHQKTAKNIIIDEKNFKKLFSRDFSRISSHVNNEYRIKIKLIEEALKKEIIGSSFKTVWSHGDYKVENVLFNSNADKVVGVIDWDLSRNEGLPFLDIFYLLLYKEGLVTKNDIRHIFNDRFLKMQFNPFERKVIDAYMRSIQVPDKFIKPMLIMFYLHHIVHRFGGYLTLSQPFKENWLKKQVYATIDEALNVMKGTNGDKSK